MLKMDSRFNSFVFPASDLVLKAWMWAEPVGLRRNPGSDPGRSPEETLRIGRQRRHSSPKVAEEAKLNKTSARAGEDSSTALNPEIALERSFRVTSSGIWWPEHMCGYMEF